MRMMTFDEMAEDLASLEGEDRWIALREFGEGLAPMPEALKTSATLVPGCLSKVWTYPERRADGNLHFFADADAAFPKGVIAVVLSLVQDRSPAEILQIDIAKKLEPLKLARYLHPQRTNGIPHMIALIRETAARYA